MIKEILTEGRESKKSLENGSMSGIKGLAKELGSLLRKSEIKVRIFDISGTLLSMVAVSGIINAVQQDLKPNIWYAGTIGVVAFAGGTLLHLAQAEASNIRMNKRLQDAIIRAMVPPSNYIV